MSAKPTKKGNSKPLAGALARELEALAGLADEKIDTRDIPEQKDWSGARRGVFRPVKQQLTLRLDADLIEWFRMHGQSGEGYQTRINSALRKYVTEHERHASRARDKSVSE